MLGSTFIALKEGLTLLPPLVFAAARFILAALLMGSFIALSGRSFKRPQAKHLTRLLLATTLGMTLNYGLLFWGTQHLPSGLSGLVSFAAVALP
ncbi:MAG: EamA family transporter [Deinococcales bacterium]